MNEMTQDERTEAYRRRREAREQILVLGDPVLRERAAEVTVFDRRLKDLVERMVGIMHDASGVGLAAPQVGVLQRVVVYDVGDEEPAPRALINPVLDEYSPEVDEDEEGCLSVPGVTMPVMRSVALRVRGFDETGAAVDFKAEGFVARVIQHEADHLEGVLIVDRTTRSARAAAMRALREREEAAARRTTPGWGP